MWVMRVHSTYTPSDSCLHRFLETLVALEMRNERARKADEIPEILSIGNWKTRFCHDFFLVFQICAGGAVDGRNPANQLRLVVYLPLITGFYTSQVVVWDFWTINSINEHVYQDPKFRPFFFPPGATAAAGARWCLWLHGTAETLATSHVGVCPGVAGVTWRQWKVGLVLGLCVIICLELCRVIFSKFWVEMFVWLRKVCVSI